jgi:hypothetical protein
MGLQEKEDLKEVQQFLSATVLTQDGGHTEILKFGKWCCTPHGVSVTFASK